MKRRNFVKDTGIVVLGIGVFGSIRWSDDRFIGNNATTTDILDPFYRPAAPVRININPPEFTGELFHLSGKIYKEDGKTAAHNCLIEIWQCDQNGVYDNTSEDYKYRGAQKTGIEGKYHFITTQPISYPAGPNSNVYRPAHIHLRISSEKQQDLIT